MSYLPLGCNGLFKLLILECIISLLLPANIGLLLPRFSSSFLISSIALSFLIDCLTESRRDSLTFCCILSPLILSYTADIDYLIIDDSYCLIASLTPSEPPSIYYKTEVLALVSFPYIVLTLFILLPFSKNAFALTSLILILST